MESATGTVAKNVLRIKSSKQKVWDRNKYGLLFITPWLLGFLIFNLFPMLYSLLLSFTNFNMFKTPDIVGFSNYIFLFTKDPRFINACVVTLKYVLLGVPFQLIVALILALVLNKGIPGLKYFRAIYYLPALMGGSVAIAILWRQVFDIEGIINQFLITIGLTGSIVQTSWVTDPTTSIYTLILLRMWQFGSPMIIFLAGLKQVPRELYESAALEGASAFKQFTHITFPFITPIVLFNLIMQIISAFQTFTPAYIIGGVGGGAMDSTLFYTLYIYIIGFNYFKMGMASALAWIMLIVISIFSFIIFKTSAKWVYYDN